MKTIPIQPYETEQGYATQLAMLSLEVVYVDGVEKGRVNYNLFTTNPFEPLASFTYVLTDEQYAAWGSDNSPVWADAFVANNIVPV